MPIQNPYFDNLPATPYTFESNNPTSNWTAVTDIVSYRAAFRQVVKNWRAVAFYDYFVTDGEPTPEILSEKLYGTPQYHYILLLANDIYSIYSQWVMPYSTFIRYLQKKYASSDLTQIQKRDWTLSELSAIPSPVAEFRSWTGRRIDFSTYSDHFLNNSEEQKPTYSTYYEYEESLNEAKRSIVIPRAPYVSRIHRELHDLMSTKTF